MPAFEELWAVVLYNERGDMVDILPSMYTSRAEALAAAKKAGPKYCMYHMKSAEIAWFIEGGGGGGRVFIRDEQYVKSNCRKRPASVAEAATVEATVAAPAVAAAPATLA